MTGNWRDRRVLVTGARGFIATHLCRRLVLLGAHVHGISSTTAASHLPGMTWSRVNLVQYDDMRLVLLETRPDVVFHLAGHVVGSQTLADVHPTFQQNLVATVQLLTAAAATGAGRIVLAGSMQEPVKSGSPDAVPCSPYAASKLACSVYARLFAGLYSLPVSIARLFMVYGPGQWDSTKLLPYVISSLLSGRAPRVSSGTRELDWIFVEDAVEGLLAVADSSRTDATPIDIGSGHLTSIREMTERVRTLIGTSIEAQFGAVPDRPLEQPHAADVDCTRAVLEWSPTVSLDAGLGATIAWHREQLRAPGSQAVS